MIVTVACRRGVAVWAVRLCHVRPQPVRRLAAALPLPARPRPRPTASGTLLFFYKNSFIRTASLIFAQNQEQLRTLTLKFEKEKKKKGKGKIKETEGKEGKL